MVETRTEPGSGANGGETGDSQVGVESGGNGKEESGDAGGRVASVASGPFSPAVDSSVTLEDGVASSPVSLAVDSSVTLDLELHFLNFSLVTTCGSD